MAPKHALFVLMGLFFVSNAYATTWTDNTLSNTTRIKATHINEIQTQIMLKEAACGMAGAAFTTKAPNTPISYTHISALRTRIAALYSAKHPPVPSSLTAMQTALNQNAHIRHSHITALRSAIDSFDAVNYCSVCGDGLVTGSEVCDNGPGLNGVCPRTCNAACSAPNLCAVCGNFSCEAGENNANCPGDCPCNNNGTCGPGENNVNCPGDCFCVNGTCDPGETHASCPGDCPSPCNNNGACDPGETTATCPGDCPSSCNNNGVCNPGETNATCPSDCPGVCNNNGIADNGETGIDCGGGGCPGCNSCADGVQNNGETSIDCGGSFNCNAVNGRFQYGTCAGYCGEPGGSCNNAAAWVSTTSANDCGPMGRAYCGCFQHSLGTPDPAWPASCGGVVASPPMQTCGGGNCPCTVPFCSPLPGAVCAGLIYNDSCGNPSCMGTMSCGGGGGSSFNITIANSSIDNTIFIVDIDGVVVPPQGGAYPAPGGAPQTSSVSSANTVTIFVSWSEFAAAGQKVTVTDSDGNQQCIDVAPAFLSDGVFSGVAMDGSGTTRVEAGIGGC